ncbi:MAG: hypothetical protein DSZ06_01255 [Sulfurospirillum sp.]|nr:MAG: hypothetical protein DSZ06_01255 [Sulfurospirillum sp.]
MIKNIIILLSLTSTFLYAQNIKLEEKIYKENCLICHKRLSFNLKQIYFDYLLKYSSEETVKLALVDYLKKPNKDISVMPKEYIRRFGIKKPTLLNDKELKMAIDYYWDRYKIFGKLK